MKAYKSIRRMLEKEFKQAGLTIGHWNISVPVSHDETITLRRDRHISEGENMRLSIEIENNNQIDQAVRSFVDTISRLEKRDAALKEAGFSHTRPPAWAHVADLTMMRVIERLNGSIEQFSNWTVGNSRARGRQTEFGTSSFSNAKVMRADGYVMRTRAHVDTISYDGLMWFSDANDSPVISVVQTIPATIASAMIGRPLDCLVDHPLLNGLDATIAEIDAKDHLTIIKLERRLVPLVAPPEGIDISWVLPPAEERFAVGY